MKIVNAENMRTLDEGTIASGTPGMVLMERAGIGATDELLEYCSRLDPRHRRHFLVVAGKGNNGGDGHVIARYLTEKTNAAVTLFSTRALSDLKGDAATNADRLPRSVDVNVGSAIPEGLLRPGTIVVDCLVGTGISGPILDPCKSLVEQINNCGLPVVAIDMPSGLDADDGEIHNVAVMADLTITMGQPKAGLFRKMGPRYRGRLRVVDIGLDSALVEAAESEGEATTAADATKHIKRLTGSDHKGSMGRILVIGGSALFPGAPCLAGLGALRCGGGLVTVAYPKVARPVRSAAHALMMKPLPGNERGVHVPLTEHQWSRVLGSPNVIVVGPGMTREPTAMALVEQVLATDKPVVLDADGLGVVDTAREVFPRMGTTVLTPHPGEMRRLQESLDLPRTGERQSEARELATTLGCHVVLKGQDSIVAAPDGSCTINTSGSPALASGGSGDVLSGMLGALLHQIDDPTAAVQTGVFLHGLAGEYYNSGQRHFIADDLLLSIGPAWKALTPFA